MSIVTITKKPEQKKITVNGMQPFATYRVVEVRHDERDDPKIHAVIDDIVILVPGSYGCGEVFNCRTNRLIHRTTGFFDRMLCIRDFTIQSVTLVQDDSELPA